MPQTANAIAVDLRAGFGYEFRTGNLQNSMNTVLYLIDTDGTTMLDSNDRDNTATSYTRESRIPDDGASLGFVALPLLLLLRFVPGVVRLVRGLLGLKKQVDQADAAAGNPADGSVVDTINLHCAPRGPNRRRPGSWGRGFRG